MNQTPNESDKVVGSELKPCPFCGGNASEPERVNGGSGRARWEIGCKTMFCFSMFRHSKTEAIAAWNRRQPPEGTAPGAEPLLKNGLPISPEWLAEKLADTPEPDAFTAKPRPCDLPGCCNGGNCLSCGETPVPPVGAAEPVAWAVFMSWSDGEQNMEICKTEADARSFARHADIADIVPIPHASPLPAVPPSPEPKQSICRECSAIKACDEAGSCLYPNGRTFEHSAQDMAAWLASPEGQQKFTESLARSGAAIEALNKARQVDVAALFTPIGAAPQPTGRVYGIIDPDYARVFTQARIIAWQYGYACVMHGSFTRDLDLLLVPWEDSAAANHDQLLKLIAQACGLRFRDGKENILKANVDLTDKPHGRKACSLFFPHSADRRWVDLSIMPTATQPNTPPGYEALKRDAERYRYLRQHPDVVIEFEGHVDTDLYEDPEKLDAAIDAAAQADSAKEKK